MTTNVNNKTRKILIIEDETMLQEALIENFVEDGYDVRGCTNAIRAFELIREDKPDLILTDLVLPNMDGFEIIEKLNESPSMSDIPILVLSNLGEEGDINKAKELGAYDFMIKSDSSLDEVTERVEKIFSELQQ